MPGWHDKTRSQQEDGRLQMVGIIQEQHPERTALFMQWKRMGWPILVDSLNLLQVEAVPLTYLIDEHGVIRYERPTDEDLEAFLATDYESSTVKPGAVYEEDSPEARYLWGDERSLDRAIEEWAARSDRDSTDGWSRFRLGVALRKRYDAGSDRVEDFQEAVASWSAALALDPNQYIWRRRIQQYGPRLDKPYPFYDWVPQAREEIEARGDVPVALAVEPRGAEFAAPADTLEEADAAAVDPDPEGRIYRDDAPLILMETVVVPGELEPEGSARVHVVFRPDLAKKAHWNNEVDDLIVWVDAPDGWKIDRRHHRVAIPPTAVSQELRRVEFEVQAPARFAGSADIPAYALYYVCEDVDGTCLYRRRDIHLRIDAVDP